jgi:hypothetical protein
MRLRGQHHALFVEQRVLLGDVRERAGQPFDVLFSERHALQLFDRLLLRLLRVHQRRRILRHALIRRRGDGSKRAP